MNLFSYSFIIVKILKHIQTLHIKIWLAVKGLHFFVIINQGIYQKLLHGHKNSSAVLVYMRYIARTKLITLKFS